MDERKRKPWYHCLRLAETALALRDRSWGWLVRAASGTIRRVRGLFTALAGRMPRRGAPTFRRHYPQVEQLEPKVMPATYTWDGGGANNNWSTAQNWTTDTVP